MTTKHTPGPWYEKGTTVFMDIGDRAYEIAMCADWSEETSANARLIAAAPDLLAALEAVLIRAEQEYQELTDGAHGKFADFPESISARAAIEKATQGA